MPVTQPSPERVRIPNESHDLRGPHQRQVAPVFNVRNGEQWQTYAYYASGHLQCVQQLPMLPTLALSGHYQPALDQDLQDPHDALAMTQGYQAMAARPNSARESPEVPDDLSDNTMRAQHFAAGQHHTTFEGNFLCGRKTPFSGRYDTGADDNFVTERAVRQAGMLDSIQRSRKSATFYHVSDSTSKDNNEDDRDDEEDDRDDEEDDRDDEEDDRDDEEVDRDDRDDDEVDREIEDYIMSHQALARRRDRRARGADTTIASRGDPITMGQRLDLDRKIRLRWHDRKAKRSFSEWFYVIPNCPYDMLLGASFVFQHRIFEAVQSGVPSVMPLVRVPQSRSERSQELRKVQEQERIARQMQAARVLQHAQQQAQQYYHYH